LKDSQNSFTWIYALFNPKTSEISGLVTYDEKLLKEHNVVTAILKGEATIDLDAEKHYINPKCGIQYSCRCFYAI